MRWLPMLVLTSCAAGTPMAAKPPLTAAAASTPAVATSSIAAAHSDGDPAIIRREEPYARIGGAKLVTEIVGAHCRVGLEIPIGPGMVSVRSGVWLVMPRSACAGDPDMREATDFILWRSAGMTSEENPSPGDRASALSVPIEFLPPAAGVAIARQLLEPLESSASTFRSKQRLDVLDGNGLPITDRARLLLLCKSNNSEACLRATTSASDRERRDLLAKSCQLENNDACYALGLDLRAHALEAMRRTPEVNALLDFSCGMGRRTSLTPILANEALTCPPAQALAK